MALISGERYRADQRKYPENYDVEAYQQWLDTLLQNEDLCYITRHALVDKSMSSDACFKPATNVYRAKVTVNDFPTEVEATLPQEDDQVTSVTITIGKEASLYIPLVSLSDPESGSGQDVGFTSEDSASSHYYIPSKLGPPRAYDMHHFLRHPDQRPIAEQLLADTAEALKS